jgi:hypothetical protein
MDINEVRKFVEAEVDENIIPSLIEFTRIPNQSLVFDAEWETNGHLDRAADHVFEWV